MRQLDEAFGFPIIVSVHSRTRVRLDAVGYTNLPISVRFLRPFGFTDFVRVQTCAYFVLSDSGTITEETSLLDLPAVTFRDAHERPEGMDAGTLIVALLDMAGFVDAVRAVRDGYTGQRRFSGAVDDYAASDVSTKIVRIILPNIDYVNDMVWSNRRRDNGLPNRSSAPTAERYIAEKFSMSLAVQ